MLGTAFSVRKGLIATAAHNVGGSDQNLMVIAPRYINMNEYQNSSVQTISDIEVKIKAINPITDVCILSLDNVGLGVPLGSVDDTPVFQEVVCLGYPHADTGRVVLTQQSARIGARIVVDPELLKIKQIVVNMQARPGQSGSPVNDFGKGKVIAMIIDVYNPINNGGISIGGIESHALHQTKHDVSAEFIVEALSAI